METGNLVCCIYNVIFEIALWKTQEKIFEKEKKLTRWDRKNMFQI